MPVLTNILTLIPIPSLPSSGYGRLGANYDYDDYYDKEFKGVGESYVYGNTYNIFQNHYMFQYYDDDESLFAASAPKPMRYRMKNYNKRVKTWSKTFMLTYVLLYIYQIIETSKYIHLAG